MGSSEKLDDTIKTKQLVYSILVAAAFSWPWIWMVASGSAGEGDLVDLISLGTLPAIIISAVIVYREAMQYPATYKWAFTQALCTAFLLTWIIPAVGIYERSGDPYDLPFYGVLAVGVIGALISRFRPKGMALTLASMAAAQVLVEMSGIIAGLGSRILLNGFFTVLWLGSALLFRNAAQGKAECKPDSDIIK